MGDIVEFTKPISTVEAIKDQIEDNNVKSLIACMIGEDDDLYIYDSGDNNMTLEEISFFAHYFELLRQQMLDEMLGNSEPVEV
jgi:hypothetical protein